MRFVLILLGAGIALTLLVAFVEPRFVFFPSRGQHETPASLGLPYRDVQLTTGDGERIAAWQLEPEAPVADVVYFHGNGGNLSMWLPVLAAMHQHKLRVLAIDYRGYGLSTGKPTETGIYRDADAAVRHAAATRTSGRPLVYWGRSLGGVVAAAAARAVTPDGLILESTFTDKAAVARTQPVLRFLNAFSRYSLSTLDHLHGFRQPVLVMHGEGDTVIPYALGRELYERITAPKTFVLLAGDHNDVLAPSDAAYWQPVLRFITSLQRP